MDKMLRVIPDGEPCALRDVRIGRHVVIDGDLYWFHGGNHSDHEGYLMRIPQMGKVTYTLYAIVQPVRIEEVGHG